MDIDFTSSRMYNYVRSRQLEGTFELGAEIGYFPITSFRIQKGWGIPPEKEWPYDGNSKNWPPKEEPENIDNIAKKNRLGVYQRIRSLKECQLYLANGKPIVTSLPIYKQWSETSDGKIEMPDPAEIKKGIHTISIFGYDNEKAELLFANSWGENWGDNGYGYLPYSYYNNLAIESWAIADINGTIPRQENENIRIINYGIPDLLAEIIHVVEIFDNKNDEFIGWSFGIVRDGYFDIEEFFIKPDYRFRNYGVQLSSEILNLAKNLNLPIRLWIPEADIERDNFYAVEKILLRMKLEYKESGVRWAAYKCLASR